MQRFCFCPGFQTALSPSQATHTAGRAHTAVPASPAPSAALGALPGPVVRGPALEAPAALAATALAAAVAAAVAAAAVPTAVPATSLKERWGDKWSKLSTCPLEGSNGGNACQERGRLKNILVPFSSWEKGRGSTAQGPEKQQRILQDSPPPAVPGHTRRHTRLRHRHTQETPQPWLEKRWVRMGATGYPAGCRNWQSGDQIQSSARI